MEHVQAWQMPFRGWGDRRALERDQPVQRRCYACDEWSSKFFVNDRDNPYVTDSGTGFDWIRGRQVGGRSLTWGRQVYRWSDLDFEANARDGVAVDWPIRYRDIEPWYQHVERFIGVSGQAEGLDQLPDGEFLPPMEMNCAERDVAAAMQRRWGRERVMTIGRCAILTQDHNGRAACHYCGPCERGCITHSYFTSLGSTLPAARATGRLTLRPNSVVHSVTGDGRRATGVRVIDAVTKEALEFRGSRRVPLRVGPRVDQASHALADRRIERRAGPQSHGSHFHGGRARDHSRPRAESSRSATGPTGSMSRASGT